MVSSVIKRNGKIVDFDKSRIEEAIFKANKEQANIFKFRFKILFKFNYFK